MAVTQHTIIKPEVLVKTALGLLQGEVVLPKIFARQNFDQFKGAKNDTVNYKIKGVLPFREYAFRNDRSAPIQFDTYAERSIPVTLSGNVYSAVQMTDEQADFDMDRWAELLEPQAQAVAAGIERKCYATLSTAPYQVVIGNAERDLKGAILEARRVLNAFKVGAGRRVILVGSQFEYALLNNDKLNLASNVGDARAADALANATIAKTGGFTFVSAPDLAPDEAIALGDEAFVLVTAAPSVPRSVYGGTTSDSGFALRWLQDYSADYLVDRSVVNAYAGARYIEDPLLYRDTNGQLVETTGQYLMRAIKLKLDGASDYPAAASQVSLATGINDQKVWTPTGYGLETDVTDPGPNNA